MTQVEEAATGVKSARRVLQILEVIAQAGRPMTFLELGERLGYPKSSLHGLLGTMVEMRWVTLDAASRSYHIGIRSWEVGQSFQRSRDIVIRTRRYLREAHAALGETIQLGILDDLDVVYIDKIEGNGPLRLVSEVGARIPAYATALGKCLLAALPEDDLEHRFAGRTLDAFTTTTIRDGDTLIQSLRATRALGYAEDDGEYTSGVFCVAVPIRTRNGTTIAAMSCSVPKSRVDMEELRPEFMLQVLKQQAEALEPNFGEALA